MPGKIPGLVDIAQRARIGVERAPLLLRQHPHGQSVGECPEPSFPLRQQAPCRIRPGTGAHRERQLLTAPAMLQERRVGGRRDERANKQRQDGRFETRHVPAGDDHQGFARGDQARHAAGEWALERRLVVDESNAFGDGEVDVRRRDHDHLARDGSGGLDRAVEERPAVDRLGKLVATEARRAPTREDDRADGRELGRGHVPPRAPAGARGPGTWPAGVRSRMPRRSRSSRIPST